MLGSVTRQNIWKPEAPSEVCGEFAAIDGEAREAYTGVAPRHRD